MRSLLVAACLCACSPITPFRTDAGADAGAQAGGTSGGTSGGDVGGGNAGGGTTGGGLTAGGSSGGGASAGGASGGGAAAGGSSGGSIDGGLFTWTAVTVPMGVAVRSLHGSGTDFFATTYAGGLLASTSPTNFAAVSGFSHPDVDDVYVTPSKKVFISTSANWAYVCTSGDCRLGMNYSALANQNPSDVFYGLCGSGEAVFAVGAATSLPAILFEYSVDRFVRRSTTLGVSTARNCVALGSSFVRIAGDTGVAAYDGGVSLEVPITSGTASWRYVAFATPSDGLLVGRTTTGAVARFDGSIWTELAGVPTAQQFEGVVALSATEFFVVATVQPGRAQGAFLFDGAWRPISLPPSLDTIEAAFAPDARQLYLVVVEGSGRHVVWLGTR